MAKYIIDETTLVGFGDQARRLGNVEGELTTAQMQQIFEGVEAGGSGTVYPDFLGGVADSSSVLLAGSKSYCAEHVNARYNEMVLPLLPGGIISYAHIVIMVREGGKIWAWGSKGIWFYSPTKDSATPNAIDSSALPVSYSVFNVETNTWGDVQTGNWYATFTEILYSNKDIPSGSSSATEIYYESDGNPVLILEG